MELIRLIYATFRELDRDLSPRLGLEGGWLPAECSAQPGDRLRFEIGVGEGFPVLRGSGEVVALAGDGESGVAVRFSSLDRASRVLLERLVRRHATTGGSRVVLPLVEDGVVGPAGEADGVEAGEELEGESEGRPDPEVRDEEEAGPLLVAELESLLERQARAEGHRRGSPYPLPPMHATQAIRPPSIEPVAVPGSEGEDAAAEVEGESFAWRRAAGGTRPGLRRPSIRWGAIAAAAALGVVALLWIRGSGEGPAAGPAPTEVEPAVPAPAAAPAADPPAAAAASPDEAQVVASPPFSEILGVEVSERGESTVVTLRLDGAGAGDRLRSERIGGSSPRELIKIAGVSTLPRPAARTLDGPRLRALRMGLHEEAGEPTLWLVADLAGVDVRLAGIHVRDDALELVFVSV